MGSHTDSPLSDTLISRVMRHVNAPTLVARNHTCSAPHLAQVQPGAHFPARMRLAQGNGTPMNVRARPTAHAAECARAHADDRAWVGSTRPGHVLIAPSGQLVVPRLARIDSPPSSVEARPAEPPHAEHYADAQEHEFEHRDHAYSLPRGPPRYAHTASTSMPRNALICRCPGAVHTSDGRSDMREADRGVRSKARASTRPRASVRCRIASNGFGFGCPFAPRNSRPDSMVRRWHSTVSHSANASPGSGGRAPRTRARRDVGRC